MASTDRKQATISEIKNLLPLKEQSLFVADPYSFSTYYDGYSPRINHRSNIRVEYQLEQITLILPIHKLMSEYKEDSYTIEKVTLKESIIVVQLISTRNPRKYQYIDTWEAHIDLETFTVIYFELIDTDENYTW